MNINREDTEKVKFIINDTLPTICNGSLGSFKDLIKTMHSIENKDLLNKCHSGTEIIYLICKYNRTKHLRYLLQDSHILHYLTNNGKDAETHTKFKTDAFYYAMRSNNFDIVEMLYDYWSGDLHWQGHKEEFNNIDVKNLSNLNDILEDAFDEYQTYFLKRGKYNNQNVLKVRSLIAFNDFQIELYTKLNKLKTDLISFESESEFEIRIKETYAIKNMILALFNVYEKHLLIQSKLENTIFKMNDNIAKDLFDTITLIHKIQMFAQYEVFYRKLDTNFCLLILDNLHLLKLRLSMPKDSYQKIENKLYYFMYHISNNWNIYCSRRRKIIHTKILNSPMAGILCVDHELNRDKSFYNIYLERRDFETVMRYFKTELECNCIEDNIRKNKEKLPKEENNSLMLLPHLRDDYSLKRISHHIAQLHSVDAKFDKRYSFLLIERTLQVVGEFIKCSPESLHMQHTTEALLKAEISVEVVNHLKALRNLLCHDKNAEILKRIEMEENNPDIFDSMLGEMLYIKKKIDEVIKVHKPLMERDLIQNAMKILHNRRNEMPELVNQVYYNSIDFLNQLPYFMYSKAENRFYEERWAPQGYSKSLMNEVSILAELNRRLESKYKKANKNVFNITMRKMVVYKEKIKESLKKIKSYKEMRCMNISDREKFVNKIKSNSSEISSSFIEKVDVNKVFANIEHHWNFIENILQFFVHKTRIFNDTIEELKFGMFSYYLWKLSENSFESNDMENNVISYLDMMEQTVNNLKKRIKGAKVFPVSSKNTEESQKNIKFSGIEEFTNKLKMTNFLTAEEKKHLESIIIEAKHCYKNDFKKSCVLEQVISKIENDDAIPKKLYENFIKLVHLESKSQRILNNLVMGFKRVPLSPQCFSKRVLLLIELTKQQTTDKLILRYKLDKTFRMLLEVLLFDIFIILEHNKNSDVMKKSSKLMAEMNLRNMLTHGSPLLEVVGNVLDSNDLPTELIKKALDFIRDKKSIDALCLLSELDFDFMEVKILNPEQKNLLNEFQSSPRWKDYLRLRPDLKKSINEKQNKLPEINETSMALLQAIKKNDARLVQESIDRGGSVNFIDNNKKAMVHYAAMKGSVELLDVLIKNGAQVNICNDKESLTALHYSAMNNFKDAVVFLLENGADCFALDNKGRTPVYYAGIKNHVNVCSVLKRAMKK